LRCLNMNYPILSQVFSFFVIETPDRIQHMFWRAVDEKSPLYTEAFADRYGHVIPDTYKQMDEILGLVMSYLDEDTTLMVISDHGFKSFRRAVHLNSWLRDHGFLVLTGGNEGKNFFQNVDWPRTKAYAVGLGSIYLNLKGRESQGIVLENGEAEALKKQIVESLKKLKDEDGAAVVRNVYQRDEVFEGKVIDDAPDLLVGLEEGYRTSWQTALGATPEPLIEDNLKKWSGDHINDASIVPGIFFSNQKLHKKDPSIYDLSPTILHAFGLESPLDQRGTFLFAELQR